MSPTLSEPFCIPISNEGEFWLFHFLTNTWSGRCSHLDNSSSIAMFSVVLLCISLMTYFQLLIQYLYISLMKWFPRSPIQFLGCLYFYCWVVGVICSFLIIGFYQICLLKIWIPACDLSYSPDSVFCWAEAWILINCNLFILEWFMFGVVSNFNTIPLCFLCVIFKTC